MAGEDVVALMEILTSEILAPETPLLDTLSQIGIELGRIVERKRTDERLRQNELLAAIGLTAAKLAHEISNPLNGMYTATQLLEEACKDPKIAADEVIPSTVKEIKKEIERLRNLLYDFRILSRPIKLDFEVSDVAAIAREVALLEGPRYSQQGITVELDFPSDLPKVTVDREKIKQALLNLCQNGADAMTRGGQLTIRGYELWGALCIEVCDTGTGLPEGMNIFEIFTTTKRGGTGLGLPIVQQIVAAHQGSVTFASEPGKGTIFRLTLPVGAAK
jgi:signal transduction histidine kinase